MTQTQATTIRYFFDFSCPYAYLASRQLRDIELRSGVAVQPAPMLLGGVFHALGQAQNLSTTLSPAKQRHNRLDLLRQAAWIGAPLRSPLRHPNRTVDALRLLLAAPSHAWPALIDAFFAVYWVEAGDLADVAVQDRVLAALGLPAAALRAEAEGPAIRGELRRRTDEAVALGVFGAPTFVVGDQLFFGADRIEMVIRAARDGWRPNPDLDSFDFNQTDPRPAGAAQEP